MLTSADDVTGVHATGVFTRSSIGDVTGAAVGGDQRVAATLTTQHVVPEATEQAVQSRPSSHKIGVVPSSKVVRARAADDRVQACLPLHEVPPAASADDVVGRGTSQRLASARAGDRALRTGAGSQKGEHSKGKRNERETQEQPNPV